jgi:hypothetical protein
MSVLVVSVRVSAEAKNGFCYFAIPIEIIEFRCRRGQPPNLVFAFLQDWLSENGVLQKGRPIALWCLPVQRKEHPVLLQGSGQSYRLSFSGRGL